LTISARDITEKIDRKGNVFEGLADPYRERGNWKKINRLGRETQKRKVNNFKFKIQV